MIKLLRIYITCLAVYIPLCTLTGIVCYQYGRASAMQEIYCAMAVAPTPGECPKKDRNMSGLWMPERCDENGNCV